ncbi:hypothetical protein MITS9504_01280 [Synechococcus sp. MIT S9504]|nr:hypothetical protein MITS9504_01280 [Synechococcus sp. MIT S9504]
MRDMMIKSNQNLDLELLYAIILFQQQILNQMQ